MYMYMLCMHACACIVTLARVVCVQMVGNWKGADSPDCGLDVHEFCMCCTCCMCGDMCGGLYRMCCMCAAICVAVYTACAADCRSLPQ